MRIRGVVVMGIAVAIAVTGCATTSAPDAEPSSTASPTPTAASPSPTPTPAADPVTCDTLVDDADEAKYAAAGWVASPDYEQRAADEKWPTLAFVTYGGVLCQWGQPSSDATDMYGYSPITAAQADAEKARLTSAGYAVSDALGGTVFEAHGEYLNEFYLFLDDSWYYSTLGIATLEKAVRNVEAR
jgi:hypothetical protein